MGKRVYTLPVAVKVSKIKDSFVKDLSKLAEAPDQLCNLNGILSLECKKMNATIQVTSD